MERLNHTYSNAVELFYQWVKENYPPDDIGELGDWIKEYINDHIKSSYDTLEVVGNQRGWYDVEVTKTLDIGEGKYKFTLYIATCTGDATLEEIGFEENLLNSLHVTRVYQQEYEEQNPINVEILHYTPLYVVSDSIRTCYNSNNKSDTFSGTVYCPNCGSDDLSWSEDTDVHNCSKCAVMFIPSGKSASAKDRNLIKRIGITHKHDSTLRHAVFTVKIENISTKTLMALTRHKTGGDFSVQSSRFTLGKFMKDETEQTLRENWTRYLTPTKIKEVDDANIEQLVKVFNLFKSNVKLDDLNMMLPQAYKYTLNCTFNLQWLRHFLSLRLTKQAHWDIQELAKELAHKVPIEYQYLIEDILETKEK